MTKDYDITQHQWHDKWVQYVSVSELSLNLLVNTSDPDGILAIQKQDARALCQHFYGFDPETIKEQHDR